MARQLADFESSYDAITSENNERKSWHSYIPVTIEPAVLLFCAGTLLPLPVTTNLFLVHTCENSLGFNHTICQELGDKTYNDTNGLETKVQHETTYFTLGKSMIESFIPAILSFFIGPWSDINGRKPTMMWPALGFALTYIIFLVESLFPSLPVSVLMVSSLPAAFSGGFISFISGMYSYISDVSKSDKRTLRLGMVEVAVFCGLLVGSVSVSYIYNAAGQWGYVTVYAVSAACCLLAWLYLCLFVQESVMNRESEYPCCCLSSGLFKNHYVADMLSICRDTRSRHTRTIILILFVILGCCIGTLEGEGSVLFLFTREKFGWNLHKFSIFAGVALAINIVGIFFGTHVLGTCFHFSPAVLAACGFFMKIIAAVAVALSPTSSYLYLGALIALPGACIGPWCRSILSTSVPKADIGKIFAFAASVESLAPIAASPLYTLLYNTTMQSFSGAFLLLSAGVFTADLILLIVVVILQRGYDDDQNLQSSLIEEENIQQ